MATSQNQSVPRTVIRGESPSTPNLFSIAIIDWFGFTVKSLELIDVRNALENLFNLQNIEWEFTGKGWSGYKYRIELGQYGWVAYGGIAQRNTINVQLRPTACCQFKNIDSIIAWLETHKAKITRCDLAHDDYEGETININQARQWLEEGGFTNKGRKPKPTEYINHDKTIGDTFYIGKRANGKMLRIYEKGKEQGDGTSKWNRVEVEFRSKDRVIPYDILKCPGKYLAGAYPCLAFLSSEQDHIKTIKKSYDINIQHVKQWLNTAAGKSINALMIHESGDIYKIISEIQREGLPKRLNSFDNFMQIQIAPQSL